MKKFFFCFTIVTAVLFSASLAEAKLEMRGPAALKKSACKPVNAKQIAPSLTPQVLLFGV